MKDSQSKLTLSAEELELVCNSGWIHTKQRITETVVRLFGAVHEKQRIISEQYLKPKQDNENPIRIPAKISRGERYLGLPYVVLDYPRCFGNEELFAIRTLFWWGNFFSVQLLIQGKFRDTYAENLVSAYEKLEAAGFSICIADTLWQHHFERDNFLPVEELSPDAYGELIRQKSFIKLGKKISLQEWNDAEDNLIAVYELLMKLLSGQAPSR